MGCVLVKIELVGEPIKVNFGLVCTVTGRDWDYLACSDLGYIETSDEGYLIVKKIETNGI